MNADPTTATWPSIGYLVWRLSIKWRTELDRTLEPFDLTSARYALMASLHGLSQSGGLPTQRELADFSGLEPMFVSKLARALEQAGLIARQTKADDPRARELTLTTNGQAVLDEARAIVSRLEERRLAALGTDDATRHQLGNLLHTLLHQPLSADAPPDTAGAPAKGQPHP
ncbi:MarR family winged helix-turn-helix transcriptional regulator [Phytoactinopolyspora limicola]|uniref:MarR family winged helix-turn-helix transcriptional regulator n=1 Tax=Phytoactinopolyspora limicola TaxID=2715536 RepID=UPI001407DEA8|nr:MarR family transcriptional regulator [Phytoactinopolyspora limicola]